MSSEVSVGAGRREDAVVHDEGEDHRGVPAIKRWLALTVGKYHFTIEPTGLSLEGSEVVLTMKLWGEFPRSQISASCHFTVHEDRIARLNAG